jgi:MerR family transcriptional regulator, redox-sensitive transcriptional activator SoxR
MRELSIGKVAEATGLSASALRYYEKVGLLPAPPRRSRQRRYDSSIFGRIELIRVAFDAGFTIRETRTFLSGFAADTPPAARWQALAARKLPEVDQAIKRAQRMKWLLESSFRCRCLELADCERYLSAKARSGESSSAARRGTRR